MSKEQAKSKYEQLNDDVIAALGRMREACDRNDKDAVEFEDRIIINKLEAMKATRMQM
jgi:ribosomal protein L14